MNEKQARMLVKTLYGISFFSNLTVKEIDLLLSKFITRVYPGGKTIVPAGIEGQFFAVITEGAVKVLKKKFLFKKILAELKPGDYFGEVSLISDLPTTAQVKAMEKTEVFILMKDAFREVLEANPKMADKIGHTAQIRKFESSI